MRRNLSAAERLIVAADFRPPIPMSVPNCPTPADQYRSYVGHRVLDLATRLKGTGVYLKVNSALRACGYGLIGMIRARGLRVFADLKLCDIGETLSIDGVLLREAKPELLTAMCVAGPAALKALKAELPDTEVLGVTVLTSLTEKDATKMLGCSIEEAVSIFARIADIVGLDGLISSPKEVAALRQEFGPRFTINTPAIRPAWAQVKGDDQNQKRVMTPYDAIKAGADRIVVGRPITQASDPLEAVERTLAEIETALRECD